jgi:SAM-dependent methyltransferase
MTYAAPYDELAGRIAGTVGYVTASHMFCHLNRPTLVAVLRSVYRLLAPGGYILAQQHLRQLFDGLDCPTPFVALRYSEWVWENIINSDTMSYNRLKVRDYQEALEEAGFEVCLMEVEPGQPEDFEKLSRARIHPMFSKFTREELAARHLFLVARKPL